MIHTSSHVIDLLQEAIHVKNDDEADVIRGYEMERLQLV